MLLNYRVHLFFPTWFLNVDLLLGENEYILKSIVFFVAPKVIYLLVRTTQKGWTGQNNINDIKRPKAIGCPVFPKKNKIIKIKKKNMVLQLLVNLDLENPHMFHRDTTQAKENTVYVWRGWVDIIEKMTRNRLNSIVQLLINQSEGQGEPVKENV